MYPENLHVLPQLFLQHDAGSLFQIKVPWPIHLAMYSLQEVQEYTIRERAVRAEAVLTSIPDADLLPQREVPDEHHHSAVDMQQLSNVCKEALSEDGDFGRQAEQMRRNKQLLPLK